jgi:hypothetical protein
MRTLSAFADVARQRDDAELILLLEITLYRDKFIAFPGSLTIRVSDRDRVELGEEWSGHVVGWGDLTYSVDESATFDVVLNNTEAIGGVSKPSALLRHGLNEAPGSYDFYFADATLYILFRGGSSGDEIRIVRLIGEEVVDITAETLELRFTGAELFLDITDGTAVLRQLSPLVLLLNGFEDGNINLETEGASTHWTLKSNPSALSLTTGRPGSGSQALRSVVTAGQTALGWSRFLAPPVDGKEFWRVYFRRNSGPTVGPATIITGRTSAPADAYSVQIETTGILSIENHQSSSVSDGLFTTAVGTWYRLEVRAFADNAASPVGELEFRLYEGDSIELLDTAAIALETVLPVTQFWFGPFPIAGTRVTTVSLDIDDICIHHYQRLQNSDFIGPGHIRNIPLLSDFSVQWSRTGTGLTENIDAVDDVPGTPNDNTDYVSTLTAGQVDRYRLDVASLSLPENAIPRFLAVHSRFRSNTGSLGSDARYNIWDNLGRLIEGQGFDMQGLTYNIDTEQTQHITTILGRSVAQLEDFHVGLEALSPGVNERRVTALWVNLEYQD